MSDMDPFASDQDPVSEVTGRAPDSELQQREPNRDDMKAMAAIADGSLRTGPRQSQIEADPQLHALLDEQRAAVALVAAATADVRAPDSLRAMLETLEPADLPPEPTPRPRRVQRPPRRRGATPRRPVFAGLAGAAVVLVLVLALTLSGTSGSPTVAQAASLAKLPATMGAPAHLAHGSDLVDISEDEVPFPYWQDEFKWKTTGARTDKVSGRTATTVFYAGTRGRRLAYVIVSGKTLAAPAEAKAVTRAGIAMLVLTAAGQTIVTWQRDDHSCVLSATGVAAVTLERLASWRGNGKIPY